MRSLFISGFARVKTCGAFLDGLSFDTLVFLSFEKFFLVNPGVETGGRPAERCELLPLSVETLAFGVHFYAVDFGGLSFAQYCE
jgi:hypothetical protein